MTRQAVPILTLAALLLLTARAPAERPETKSSYANPDVRIHLDSPADYPLAIRTKGFSDHLDGTLCEFMQGPSKLPLVNITGVLVHRVSDRPLADEISAREKELSSLKNVTEVTNVASKKLDRQPGEWLYREYRVVNFGTTFRYFVVYIADGKDRYALIAYGNAREDEKMLGDSAAAIVATLSIGGGVPPVIAAGNPPATSRPTTRPFATTTAAGDARRVFAVARPTSLPAFPKIEPFRPSPTSRPATEPTGPGVSGIIFATNAPPSSSDKPSLISMISPDGTGLKNFFNPGPNDIQGLGASPDGRRIAFSMMQNGNREIFDIDLEGKSPRNLTNNPRSDEKPVYSPDGKRIAFLSDRGGARPELYVMNADGSNPRRREGDKGWDALPSWSPDGKTLYFCGAIDGRDGLSAATELYSVTPDGAGLKALTHLGGAKFHTALVYGISFMPDAARIGLAIRPPNAGDLEGHVYVANPDGSDLHILVKGAEANRFGNGLECSADGRFYFQRFRTPPGTTELEYSIFSCDRTGGDLKSVVPPNLVPYRFHLSPDGKRILFISLAREPGTTIQGRLYVADADGTNSHVIAASKFVTDAIWLPSPPTVR